MNGHQCHAVALDYDGYEFTASEHGEGDIHVVDLTDVAQIRSVNIDESDPAKTVLSAVGIEEDRKSVV